jgi:molecular chaperone DnaK
MREEAEKNATEDEKKKAKIEAENNAESVIFQTKKALEEFKDKIDDATKKKIEDKVAEVEEARKSGDPETINPKIDELNKIVQEIGAKVYQEAAAKQQAEAGKAGEAGAESKPEEGKNGEKVVDAEFTEKEEKKKE